MAAISTALLNDLAHQHRCLRLGVEDFKVDEEATLIRGHSLIETNVMRFFNKRTETDRYFYDTVVKWKVNGEWFKAVIPVKTRTKEEHGFLFSFETVEEDHNAMEEELIRLIEESKGEIVR